MKVSDLLQSRRKDWGELELLCIHFEGKSSIRREPEKLTRFASLYRSLCADLALAEAYQLPPEVTRYLHRLVGRAHNQLYRSREFTISTWARTLLFEVPQQLFHDAYLRLAFCLFWGAFLVSAMLATSQPGFSEAVLGPEQKQQLKEMYDRPVSELDPETRGVMLGFYVLNNAGIGLRCFAFGLVYGIGGMLVTLYNAVTLGSAFGYMSTLKQWANFSEFVTAHGPFELTAIVLSAAAGMRMGFALIYTGGMRRIAALQRSAVQATPVACVGVILFVMAALIEAYISPAPIPYGYKAGVAVLSAGLLMFYFVGLGIPREAAR
ncbi:MAG: stage II sporulation protein M [Thermoguttaceae bacterium]